MQGINLSNMQKFGTQAKRALSIKIYTNGDPKSPGVSVLLGKAVNSWEKVRHSFLGTFPIQFHAVRNADFLFFSLLL